MLKGKDSPNVLLKLPVYEPLFQRLSESSKALERMKYWEIAKAYENVLKCRNGAKYSTNIMMKNGTRCISSTSHGCWMWKGNYSCEKYALMRSERLTVRDISTKYTAECLILLQHDLAEEILREIVNQTWKRKLKALWNRQWRQLVGFVHKWQLRSEAYYRKKYAYITNRTTTLTLPGCTGMRCYLVLVR